MDEENKVVSLEDFKPDNTQPEDEIEKVAKAIEDPDNPLTDVSIERVQQMLKNLSSIVQVMEEQWRASEREFKLTNTHIQELHKWNEDHKTPMPDNLTDKEKDEWDVLNGLDCITDEEIHRIFGDEHLIYGVEHSHTVDRIKGAMEDFMHWILAMREYRQVHDAYVQLLEIEEDKNIQILQAQVDAIEDPEKKAKLQSEIDLYYDQKLLGYLRTPLDQKMIDRTVAALSDSKKVEYWISRTREKLSQLKISSKFILELSKFENRFLEEKYWPNSNVLLLYFMQLCIYANIGDKKDNDRLKVISFMTAMDGVIRRTMSEDKINQILDNIRVFEDQFLGLCPTISEDVSITPPVDMSTI